MGILFAVGAAFFSALSNVYLKKLFFNKISTKELAPFSILLAAVTLAIASPWYFKANFTPYSFVLFAVIILFGTLSNYFYFLSIEKTQVSNATIYLSLAPIFTLVVAVAFGEPISSKTIIAVFGIVMSIYILNMSHGSNIFSPLLNAFKNNNHLALWGAFFFGSEAVLIKLLFETEAINVPTYYFLRSIFLFFTICILLRPNFKNIERKIILPIWGRVLIVVTQLLLYLTAIEFTTRNMGNVVAVATVASSYPAFVLILSYFLFKEKITLQKGFAILVIILFITGLNFS